MSNSMCARYRGSLCDLVILEGSGEAGQPCKSLSDAFDGTGANHIEKPICEIRSRLQR